MKKRLVLLLLVLCALTLPVFAADFSDVPEDHWAADEIARAAESGAVSGYENGEFRPARPVTGAHFCVILARSFLAEEFEATPETGGPWWERAVEACMPVLGGTSLEDGYKAAGNAWGDFVNRPLSRCDMAAILYNLLTAKEVRLPSLEERMAVQGRIVDWKEIPGRYQLPVATCYVLGLLNGQKDGTFGGGNSLNRAQACVVWSRLAKLLPAKTAEEAAQAAEMPVFGLQGEETVQQMMNRINARTPRTKEGLLPNGKPRTEENILELLALVKAGCPDGTVWTATSRFDYNAPSMGRGRGCLSFGMAVSDFLFGEERPLTQNRNFRNLKVGDMIHIKSEAAERVLILTSVDRENDAYTACELIDGDKVNWSGWGPLSEFVDSAMTTVYSRG